MDAKSVLEPLYAESQNIYSSTYLNILSSLASAYASIENYENAEAYFLKGIEVGNDIAKHNQNSYMFERLVPWFEYGSMLYQLERYDDAIDVLYKTREKFSEIKHPSFYTIYIRLYNSLKKRNRLDEALEILKEAKTKYPENDDIKNIDEC